jgi:hypothetical protein
MTNEILHKIKEERNTLHTSTIKKANCICYILLRNCLLKHFIEGKIEGRTGRIHKQPLDDLQEKEALDYTLWRIRFGRGYGPVVRQNRKRR